ncbi:MAG: (E)-4-hydroxy-3-methylbut-2-enyl-diphosphate synthase [Elusimicrobia bacterium]|nr:(E)-4-hydroxy-3-methylbut-2-enyl-diphosphate synthase [Elusimicrobiota bacterium]
MVSREIKIGRLALGAGNPVRVQGMLKEPLDDLDRLLGEARRLVENGAEMVRCALPSKKDVKRVFSRLKELRVPLIADCHFQSRIALDALEEGFHKVRLNPGNMTRAGMKEAVAAAREKKAALRLGFNSGSFDAETGLDMAKAALDIDAWIKEQDFNDYVVSMKSSSVKETVEANRFFSVYSDTPLHIGVTATGPYDEGIIKSSVGLGSLLIDGIGDTVRVSLTGDSAEEIRIACYLRDLAEGRMRGLEIIACPTCSRCRMDVRKMVETFRGMLAPEDFKRPFKVAIMGCEVNGPGEAKACDIGVCGVGSGGLLIKKGEVTGRIETGRIVETLLEEFRKL